MTRTPTGSSEAGTSGFMYDPNGQLTQAGYPGGSMETFTYDGVGNRKSLSGVSYAYDAANRLLSAGLVTYAYDPVGNRTGMKNSAGMTTYTYDGVNRLVKTSLRSAGGAERISAFTYDGDGARVSKRAGRVMRKYLYDGLEVVGEFNAGGNLTTSYVHGPQIDEVLAVKDHATNSILYPLTDHLGSPIALVDSAGQIPSTFSYSAFGGTRTQRTWGKIGTADTRFRFTGRELDTESGLYHYRARAYDPATARFLQQDPLPRTPADPRMMGLNYGGRLAAVRHPLPGTVPGFLPVILPRIASSLQTGFLSDPIGLNTYPYVLNNPLRFTDPTGEFVFVLPELWELVVIGVSYAFAIYEANRIRSEPFPYDSRRPGPYTGRPWRPGDIFLPSPKIPPWLRWGGPILGIAAREAHDLNQLFGQAKKSEKKSSK